MKKPSLSLVAILALSAILAACGKGNKAGVDCPDLSGDWISESGGIQTTNTITQNGCESIASKLISGETITLSASEIDIEGGKARAEFSKDSIVLILEKTIPSDPRFDTDEAGKTITIRGTITKVSNDELNLVTTVEGPAKTKALVEREYGRTTVIRRAKAPNVTAPRSTLETASTAPSEKGNIAGVDCPDLSGDWISESGDIRSNETITQNGCESITGKLISGYYLTLSASEIDVDGSKARAEFSKDSIVIIQESTIPSDPLYGDEAGKTITIRGTFTKVSNDEFNLVTTVEGPAKTKALVEGEYSRKTVLRRAKSLR